MDNDQNFDDTTTEEDSEVENVPCDPDKLSHGCYYNRVLMVVVLDKNVISIISVRIVTVDAGYVMTVIKIVPIMDITNGLKKRIIPEQR